MNEVIKHYDALIDENNDPVYDPKPLKTYMDGWDGQGFLDEMNLDPSKSVLEIGVGTGRLAVRAAPLCGELVGIDLSPKTADRARENLKAFPNTEIICADWMTYQTDRRFDVIYSSLTFMHIRDKKRAIEKVDSLLKDGGRFVLSINLHQDGWIDCGTRKIAVYPDQPETMAVYLEEAGLTIEKQYETAFAHIFAAYRAKK